MNQLAASGDNRTRAVLYVHVSCSRTRASRIPRRYEACFALLSATSRLTSSLRHVPRLDPRFRGDDTCWLGRSRCSSCFEASLNSKPRLQAAEHSQFLESSLSSAGRHAEVRGGNDSAACALKWKLNSYMELCEFENM